MIFPDIDCTSIFNFLVYNDVASINYFSVWTNCIGIIIIVSLLYAESQWIYVSKFIDFLSQLLILVRLSNWNYGYRYKMCLKYLINFNRWSNLSDQFLFNSILFLFIPILKCDFSEINKGIISLVQSNFLNYFKLFYVEVS